MRIGLLVTSIGDFRRKGFYNEQEVGLAKAMEPLVDQVKLYKLVPNDQKRREEKIENYNKLIIYYIPSKRIGSNGIICTDVLDETLDVLIYFSDIQLSVLKVYRWTKKKRVTFLPYIGAIKSHSINRIKQFVMNFMSIQNLYVYKNSCCLAKTPEIANKLHQFGVKEIVIATVGIDIELLRLDYKNYSTVDLKRKYGYLKSDKILLFIGRMINEKQPERMVKIFEKVTRKDINYRLIMIGSGPIKNTVIKLAQAINVADKIQFIDCVLNSDIWELYRIADVYINLNQREIFGMSILEAMYYECKVVAWKAPGPNLIIENGVSGWLAEKDEEVIAKIMDEKAVEVKARDRIISNFMWSNTAHKIKEILEKKL